MALTDKDLELAYQRGYAQGADELFEAINAHLPEKHRAIIRTWITERHIHCRLISRAPSELDMWGRFTTNIDPPDPSPFRGTETRSQGSLSEPQEMTAAGLPRYTSPDQQMLHWQPPKRRPSTFTRVAAALFASGVVLLFIALYNEASHSGFFSLWIVALGVLAITVACWIAAAQRGENY